MTRRIKEELEGLLSRGWDRGAAESVRELVSALDRERVFAEKLDKIARGFALDGRLGLAEALSETALERSGTGISGDGADLLLILASLPYLHDRYRKENIPDDIFYDSMDDIRCKVRECIECKGEAGTFVAGWYDGFFNMTRFAYGRFQYEPVVYGGDVIRLSCGSVLERGGTFINFHIPSSGVPLTDDVRLDSYRRAYPHYAHLFGDGVVIFGCDSWLLYPAHRGFLPEGSNILRFMDDFEVIKGRDEPVFGDKWRVFGRFSDLDADKLPRDTSLRAAYADRLTSGKPTGEGFGVFAFDGQNIIK